MQVLKAMIVPGSFRAETLEEEKDVEKRVLKVMSFRDFMMERSIEERLVGEELAGESMKEIVKTLMAAAVLMVPAFFANLPLASVEQGERVPQTVEKWEKKMRENTFLHQMCQRMSRLMKEKRCEKANVLWNKHLPMPLHPKWMPVIYEYQKEY
ncbi:hypothetical protein I7I48_06861 [Histoplasma ohiense]|nr:hypothetical protein I7I48_06861 [Histoplasma ohiense (nom. inval.)]